MQKPQNLVVVGMSGGVDSSVAALLLKKQGYNVIGAFMKNFSETKNPFTGECNWKDEKRIAERIASILNIPLITFDFEKEYKKQVIEPMFRDYKKGITPNPDILCNKIIKFPLFWKKAKQLGADLIAMGHYARIKKTLNGFELLAGKDKAKDQSYFLCSLSQNDLSHTLFPLGNMKKEQVREIARQNNLPNYSKQGTSGICFVGKIKFPSFLEKRIKIKKGKILSPEGNLLGFHKGIAHYTIGQKILDSNIISFKKPKQHSQKRFYVAEKKGNALIVAPKPHQILKKQIIQLTALHLINPKEKMPKSLKARIRHLGELHKGVIIKKKSKFFFKFKKPIKAVAEGQTLAIYSNGKVIGSGIIKRAI